VQDCWDGLKEQYCGNFDHVQEETQISYNELYDEYISADSKADPGVIDRYSSAGCKQVYLLLGIDPLHHHPFCQHNGSW
jgi:hypothetical protein